MYSLYSLFNFAEYDSQRRYWQNVYHYHDRNPPADDAVITVCSSLSRESLKLFTRNGRYCTRAIFSKLLQVTSFHEDDIQKVGISSYSISTIGSVISRSFVYLFFYFFIFRAYWYISKLVQLITHWLNLKCGTNWNHYLLYIIPVWRLQDLL